MDNATILQFFPLSSLASQTKPHQRAVGLSQIDLQVRQVALNDVFTRALACGWVVDRAGQAVKMGGVWWRFLAE